MKPVALLQLRDAPEKCLRLNPAQDLTIGRASANRLALPSQEGVSDHHAVVRFSPRHGWLVCDWQSRDGTYLEGQRIQRCRPIGDGDEIQLGQRGPVLVFRLQEQLTPPAPAAAPPAARDQAPGPARSGPVSSPIAGGSIAIGGESFRPEQIRSASVRSEPRYPHLFSWWVLLSVGLLLLLPVRLGPLWIFWPLQLCVLAGALVLGTRKDHTLVLELHDGQARRHAFGNRRTALAHRNGIRRAIGAPTPAAAAGAPANP
jgi:hypothetical protein